MNFVVRQRKEVKRNAASSLGAAGSGGVVNGQCQSVTAARVIDRRRAAFTLLELVLVISVIVVVTALASPAIQRTFTRQALQKGADRVRVAMGQARVRAIRTGEEHAVFYTPEGSWFNVAPFSAFNTQKELAGKRQRNLNKGTYTNYEDDLLPKGVRFSAGQTNVDSRAAALLADGESSAAIAMILFYPDGTSQDAKLLFENDAQLYVQLELRGLTGTARTVRIENPENQ